MDEEHSEQDEPDEKCGGEKYNVVHGVGQWCFVNVNLHEKRTKNLYVIYVTEKTKDQNWVEQSYVYVFEKICYWILSMCQNSTT